MKKHKLLRRILFTVVCVLLALGLSAAVVYVIPIPKMNKLNSRYVFEKEGFTADNNANRLHFLNTGNSDCILIESNGKFALVDAAEDTDNVRGFPGLELTGYETRVVNYLKKVAADEQGRVTLEWVLGTHMHSDHIGGFDTIINDPAITVKTAYLQEYDERYISDYELREWDNKEVYEQMRNACQAKNVPVVSDIPTEPWQFEAFTVQFFNTLRFADRKVGENENAVGTKLTLGSQTAFLAADINNIQKSESSIAKKIGKVDLLKVGHHGHPMSTTAKFARTLNPDVSIVTNGAAKNVNPLAKFALCLLADSPIYATGDQNGIIANFRDGNIVLTNQIHDADTIA